MEENWWKIKSDILIDTPFLAVYEDRIRFNLERLIGSVNGDTQKLRPHIKTHKIGEILELFKIYNIKKIKCATIAEAELAALFHNGKEAYYTIRNILDELGHPQPATPTIVTDNSTASGIANDTVCQKRSKAMDMCFYWVRDWVCQGQFLVY